MLPGSPPGAFASAAACLTIESAKADGLEPYYHLNYVIGSLPAVTEPVPVSQG